MRSIILMNHWTDEPNLREGGILAYHCQGVGSKGGGQSPPTLDVFLRNPLRNSNVRSVQYHRKGCST
ncbi:hypothetical protein DLD82_11860 [Methanospirillum stamsii]|uniref:Uncharacterized protein n=1 Tax=Methanospirillum stamsii TaxID=1277351 RepID=A0A2V2MXU1_9EURY|nr:hypothetical protein DLD82_11860 [Methanospirillum stamsii]